MAAKMDGSINRRQFAMTGLAAFGGGLTRSARSIWLALPAAPEPENISVLFLHHGYGDFRPNTPTTYQADLRRVHRALVTQGLRVDVSRVEEGLYAGELYPYFGIQADFLPAALAPELEKWNGGPPGRSSTFLSRASLDWLQIDTQEKLASLCRV